VISGTPQFNFPNDITKIQPKVGGGASFTFNPGGYIYWDMFTPDQALAQIDTRAGTFSTNYANLTLSIVQIWSANGSSGKGATGAAIYRIYAADNTANQQVALANNTNIVSYSIVDNTGAPATSTNKDLIDLVNADPLIGNFNNFSNIQNALNTTHSGYPTNDGFTIGNANGATGTQTQVWLSTDVTGTTSGETGKSFTDTSSSNAVVYGTNNTSPAGDTLADSKNTNNLIDGRGGNDSLSTTGTGNNYLGGDGFGNDTLTAGTGANTLLGAYGVNTLTVPAHSTEDVFILQRGQIDSITGFRGLNQSGTDQLWIDTFVGSNGTPGPGGTPGTNGVGTAAGGPGDSTGTVLTPGSGSAPPVFNGSVASTPTGTVVAYDHTTGDLYFDANPTVLGQIASNPGQFLLAVLTDKPASINNNDVRYDPPTGSLDQLVQAVAGTPLGPTAAANATVIDPNALEAWNQQHLLAAHG